MHTSGVNILRHSYTQISLTWKLIEVREFTEVVHEKWCRRTELNCRPRHYQWRALPLSYGGIFARASCLGRESAHNDIGFVPLQGSLDEVFQRAHHEK